MTRFVAATTQQAHRHNGCNIRCMVAYMLLFPCTVTKEQANTYFTWLLTCSYSNTTIEHSVHRPGIDCMHSQSTNRATSTTHLLPWILWASTITTSSSSVQAPVLMSGRRWWIHLSLHCLPVLPVPAPRSIFSLKWSATSVQLRGPCSLTTLQDGETQVKGQLRSA